MLADKIDYPVVEEVSEASRTLLARMLDFDAEARPSAAQLIAAFESLLHDEPLPQYNIPEEAVRRKEQRRRAMLAPSPAGSVMTTSRKTVTAPAIPARAITTQTTSSAASKRLAALKGQSSSAKSDDAWSLEQALGASALNNVSPQGSFSFPSSPASALANKPAGVPSLNDLRALSATAKSPTSKDFFGDNFSVFEGATSSFPQQTQSRSVPPSPSNALKPKVVPVIAKPIHMSPAGQQPDFLNLDLNIPPRRTSGVSSEKISGVLSLFDAPSAIQPGAGHLNPSMR